MRKQRQKHVSVTALAKFFAGRSTDDQKSDEYPPAAVRRAGEVEHARHDADVKRFVRRLR
jgi:hypothetical protein